MRIARNWFWGHDFLCVALSLLRTSKSRQAHHWNCPQWCREDKGNRISHQHLCFGLRGNEYFMGIHYQQRDFGSMETERNGTGLGHRATGAAALFVYAQNLVCICTALTKAPYLITKPQGRFFWFLKFSWTVLVPDSAHSGALRAHFDTRLAPVLGKFNFWNRLPSKRFDIQAERFPPSLNFRTNFPGTLMGWT